MRAPLISVLASCLILPLAGPPLLLADRGGATAAQQPASPSRPQTVCPVMGGPIDKSLYVDVKGKRVYLCCAACEDAVRAEPDRYLKKIEQRGETVEEMPSPDNSSTKMTKARD